jgi:hypothetical protein
MNITRGRRRGLVSTGAGGVFFPAALVLSLGLANPAASHADTLNQELLKQAPGVIRYLKQHGYRNVGVLKFRVQKGDEPMSDRVGLLNRNLATRLEIALVLANTFPDPLGIIRDASAEAALRPEANHLRPEGRPALFRKPPYPLAWGDQRVEADAFLTGEVVVSPDLQQMTVTIQSFGRNSGVLDQVVRFEATTDAATLTEAGESFLIRGAFDSGQPDVIRKQVAATAAEVKMAQQANPMEDAAAPVALEIHYDNQRIPLEIRAGKALIQEPREGQRVTLVLRKVDQAKERYGVVVLVNGQSTLFKERGDPFQCWKWLLEPDHPTRVIKGYQTSAREAEPFRVLSPEASRQDAINYGSDVGTITLSVFRQQRGRDEALPPDKKAEDVAAISRGTFPARPPRNLPALKRQLAIESRKRGLIPGDGGPPIDSPIRRSEDFRPEPTPVMSATITYYRP